jgi:hypothetical protein
MKLELDFSANKLCDDVKLQVFYNKKIVHEFLATPMMQNVNIEFSDIPANHVLNLVMSGKTSQHTVLDKQNQIVDDVYFTLDRIEFEGLDLKEIFCQGRKCYWHNYNATNEPDVVDEFYGFIGCNGTVEFEFLTPIFLWLADYLDQ